MQRTLVTPPVLAAAALAELKDWLGIATPGDDAQLTALLRAALEACEGFTGTLPLQAGGEELLPASRSWQALASRPVQAITAVLAVPPTGPRSLLAASAYAIDLAADGSGAVRVLDPAISGTIAVRFTAGLAADWSSLPDGLRHGIVRLAAYGYRQREMSAETTPMPPAAVAALWRPWRAVRLL